MTGLLVVTMAVLGCTAIAGQCAHLWGRHRETVATDREVAERMATPLPEERSITAPDGPHWTDTAPEVEVTHIGGRWPERLTPLLLDLVVDSPVTSRPEQNLRTWVEPPDWYVHSLDRPDEENTIVVGAKPGARHASDEFASGSLAYGGRHRPADPMPYQSRHRELVNA